MKALYYAAFLNGIVAVPLLFLILRLDDDEWVMGAKTNPRWVKIFGWAASISATAALVATVVLYLAPVH